MADIITQPPIHVPIITDDFPTNGLAIEWNRWYNDVYAQLSTQNHSKVTAAQALNLTSKYISLDSTAGAMAVTLAAPPAPGITKTIEMIADGGDVTLSLANCTGGSAATTCTFSDVGDSLILISNSTKWVITKELGVSLT